jgi:hypothetical protein
MKAAAICAVVAGAVLLLDRAPALGQPAPAQAPVLDAAPASEAPPAIDAATSPSSTPSPSSPAPAPAAPAAPAAYPPASPAPGWPPGYPPAAYPAGAYPPGPGYYPPGGYPPPGYYPPQPLPADYDPACWRSCPFAAGYVCQGSTCLSPEEQREWVAAQRAEEERLRWWARLQLSPLVGATIMNLDTNITGFGGVVGASLWKGLANRVGLEVEGTVGFYGIGYFPSTGSNKWATDATSVSLSFSVPIRAFWRVYFGPTTAVSHLWFAKNVVPVSTQRTSTGTSTLELMLDDDSMLLLGAEGAFVLGKRNNFKLVGRIYIPPVSHESWDGPILTGSLSYGFFP